tara:strand:+ start:21 stop:287 length:267 start_codon:yes stop_codon:yes gene_type:complete
MYKILPQHFEKAKNLGVEIKPSTNKMKKIDVFKNDKKIVSIGDIKYLDYQMYILEKGLDYANERRKLYLGRHRKDKNLGGYYARLILW